MTNSEIKVKTLELFNRLKAGDLSARGEIAALNLHLAYEVANSYSNISNVNYIDKEDIIQIACIGLMKAIDKYNPALGYNFSTFSMACMKNELFMANRHINRNEASTLNSPIAGDENLEVIDVIIGCDSAENIFLQEEGSLFEATVKFLPECDRKFLTMRFKQLATPEQIAQALNFNSQAYQILEQDILKCAKKRMNGSFAHSILYQKYLFNNDVASFQQEFYEKLQPRYKLFFDQTALKEIPKTQKEMIDLFGSMQKIINTYKGLSNKLETFLLKNILKIENINTWDLREPFLKKFPKAMENQAVLFPALGNKEKLIFTECVIKDGKELKNKQNLYKAKRGLIKKFTIFEKNKENDEKIENKLLF